MKRFNKLYEEICDKINLVHSNMTPTKGFSDFEYGELKRGTEYDPVYFDNIQDLIDDMKYVERVPQADFEKCLQSSNVELKCLDHINDIIFIRMSCIKKIEAFYITRTKCFYGDVSFEEFKKNYT